MARGSKVRRQNFWTAAGGPSQSRVCVRLGKPVTTCRRAAKATPSSSPIDHVGRAEVRFARRPVWQRPLPTLPSVNVFRKDRSLTNDLPARLVIFHSRPGAPPSREARSLAYQKAGGYQDHWRPRVRKSKCAAQFRRPGNTSLMEPICLVENKRSALGSNFSLRGPHWVRRICLQN
jgi:hypothetical protein